MASHPVFDYEERDQRLRHRVAVPNPKPGDVTVPCPSGSQYYLGPSGDLSEDDVVDLPSCLYAGRDSRRQRLLKHT